MNRTAARTLVTATALAAALPLAGLGAAGSAAAKTLPATPVTTANLPSAAVVGQSTADKFTVTATRTNTSEKVSPCQAKALKAFSPNRVITRDYATSSGTAVAGVQVASFRTHAQAVAAADALAKPLKGCAARAVAANPDLLRDYREYTRVVLLPGGQKLSMQVMNMTDGESGRHFIVEDAVMATGTHVEFMMRAHGNTNGSLDTHNIQKTMTAALPALAR